MGDVKKGLRTVRNVVRNYNDAQVKVREATSNDPWGPAASLMSEIADMTYNHLAFSDIMQMLWKRLNDNGKDWRHVYKALVVLDYIVKAGSDKVAQHCKENLYFIQTLQNFQFFEENKDHGMNVREKAKQVCSLLTDEEKLKNERVKASKTRERFQYGAPGGIMTRGDYSIDDSSMSPSSGHPHSGSFGASGSGGGGRNPHLPAEVEAVRPQTANEEEIQLQIALAMSKEEADEEDRRRQRDDVRLQIALSESESDYQKHKPVAVSSVNELFDVFHDTQTSPPGGHRNGGSAADPWGGDDHFGLESSRPAAPAPSAAHGNGFASSTLNDPWSSGTASSSSSTAFGGGSLSNGSNSNNNGLNVYPSLPSAAAATLNPWSSLQPMSGSNSASASPSNIAAAAAKPKNPAQNFLGQNSALVDLESLVTPVRPAANAAPSSVFMNPFTGPFSGGSGSGIPTAAPINNPFHQAAAPQPTINQLRNINAPPVASYDSGLPQPLMPLLSSSPNNNAAAFQQAPNRFQQPTSHHAPVDQNFNPFL